MITLPFEVIERLLAVHHAAHDRDDRSPQTTGVLLSVVCGVVTVAATDGMILVEEQLKLDAATTEEWTGTISPGGVSALSAWSKLVLKLGKKGVSPNITLDAQNKKSTVQIALEGSAVVGPLLVALIEGTFPQYQNALNGPAAIQRAPRERIAVSSTYLARLEKLWASKGTAGFIMTFCRGVHIEPLNAWAIRWSRRCLIMPISLPD
jgi:hypothetical protein